MKIPYIRPIFAPTQKLPVSELKKNIEALKSLSKFHEDTIDGVGGFVFSDFYTSARNEAYYRRRHVSIFDNTFLGSDYCLFYSQLPRAEDIKFRMFKNSKKGGDQPVFSLANIDTAKTNTKRTYLCYD